MTLCLWNGEWCLAGRLRAESGGMSLSVRNSVGQRFAGFGFQQYAYKTFWHKHFESWDDVLFYPLLRYQGCQVRPVSWHPESEEPLLRCAIDTNEICGLEQQEYMKRVEQLRALGWHWDYREGGTKYCHVDELEKIEGPLPVGAF